MTRPYILPAFLSLLILALSALPGGLPQRAEAQQTPTLAQELETALQSTSWLRRHMALLDVSAIANCPGDCTVGLHTLEGRDFTLSTNPETSTGEILDLTALAPKLVTCYRLGPDQGSRLLALSALIGIGDEKALNSLLEDGPAQSSRVSRATQQSITAFYLERYPELARMARKNGGEITFDDIDRVKRVRVKKAAKAQKGE